jgi:L-lactate dehydrogenase complex protein LldG
MSSTGRESMLQRVQMALHNVPRDEQVALPRDYRSGDERDRSAIIEEFIERVREYQANVQEIAESDLPGAIAAACTARGITQLLVAPGLPKAWLPGGITLLPDDPSLAYEELDANDGVLTGCRLGIAQTGTIVLDGGPGQGRRALSLLPDYHLCLIREAQIVGLVPEAMRALQDSRERPMTFISGPSATSDIEFHRVEGVHGPRTLQVFVVKHALKKRDRSI